MRYEQRAKARLDRIANSGEALVLSVESSCDETAAAIVRNGREIVSQSIFSQIDIHRKYGGVVPEIASRQHVMSLLPVIDEAIAQSGLSLSDIDAVAVTKGPGLIGALLTGLAAAKSIAYAKGLPLVGVHHIEGHISANYLSHQDLEPPFVALCVSGGHTHIYHVLDYGEYVLLGQTVDDAAGEALDKVARVLGLPYPGGPNLERLALDGDAAKYPMPSGFNSQAHFNFSFSGLKTAVIQLLRGLEQSGEPFRHADIAASFQTAVVRALALKTVRAAVDSGVKRIAVCGGVSANALLRSTIMQEAHGRGIHCYMPHLSLCTDNAAMIASAGYFMLRKGISDSLELNALAQAYLA